MTCPLSWITAKARAALAAAWIRKAQPAEGNSWRRSFGLYRLKAGLCAEIRGIRNPSTGPPRDVAWIGLVGHAASFSSRSLPSFAMATIFADFSSLGRWWESLATRSARSASAKTLPSPPLPSSAPRRSGRPLESTSGSGFGCCSMGRRRSFLRRRTARSHDQCLVVVGAVADLLRAEILPERRRRLLLRRPHGCRQPAAKRAQEGRMRRLATQLEHEPLASV